MKIVIFETKSHVTLTLTLDDLESHIVVNVSSTLTNTTIWFVAAVYFTVDVQTDGRTFLPGLLKSRQIGLVQRQVGLYLFFGD